MSKNIKLVLPAVPRALSLRVFLLAVHPKTKGEGGMMSCAWSETLPTLDFVLGNSQQGILPLK